MIIGTIWGPGRERREECLDCLWSGGVAYSFRAAEPQSWRDPDIVTGVEFALGELGASELHHFQRSAASLWASLGPSV